ncbi:hypothetical protein [Lentibacillus cibarius]|uniref:Phospholipase A2 domain-containing protein n=1 Tax=Lentibacillus cibarius TaxID=2583219 RepID=A0A5S3QFR3_9BACI|nr:hypothetical protein [Lentibacillus cibarius]RYG71091.1 hypothetical protein EU245_15105 [Lentibacillus lipolyticus]TMN18796.1 hypothetical protein FFL34_17735 [Lentibacillus cibarius]TMN18824.1 hypothetical protein FFL34_17900 [Lentibacillus cibarius]
MIGNLIDGKHLRGKELNQKLNELYEKEPFKNLIATMQNQKSFEVNDLNPRKAYVFDAEFREEDNMHFFSSSILHLVDEKENISILYNELPNVQDHYFGQILQPNSNALHEYLYDGGKVQNNQKNTELNKLAFSDDYEELPDNKNYKSGNLFNDQIETQSWFTGDGCLPGGYQHCGGNCGYDLDHGGGTPINDTDDCCVAHDNCWKTYGDWDSCCDKRLIECVAGHTTVAAASIREVFTPSSLRCLFG